MPQLRYWITPVIFLFVAFVNVNKQIPRPAAKSTKMQIILPRAIINKPEIAGQNNQRLSDPLEPESPKHDKVISKFCDFSWRIWDFFQRVSGRDY